MLVHLRYADPARDVPMAGQSILHHQGSARRDVDAHALRPVGQAARVSRRVPAQERHDDGQGLDEDHRSVSRTCSSCGPNVDVLDLTLIPAGRWADVIQAVLSLRYIDGSYQRDAQFNFKTADEFKKWAVLLLNADASGSSSTRSSRPSRTATRRKQRGSRGRATRRCRSWSRDRRVSTSRSRARCSTIASTPLAKVDLEYNDPQGRHERGEHLRCRNRRTSSPGRCRCARTARGTTAIRSRTSPSKVIRSTRDWEVTETELIVVPRYSIPKVGAEFSAKLAELRADAGGRGQPEPTTTRSATSTRG